MTEIKKTRIPAKLDVDIADDGSLVGLTQFYNSETNEIVMEASGIVGRMLFDQYPNHIKGGKLVQIDGIVEFVDKETQPGVFASISVAIHVGRTTVVGYD